MAETIPIFLLARSIFAYFGEKKLLGSGAQPYNIWSVEDRGEMFISPLKLLFIVEEYVVEILNPNIKRFVTIYLAKMNDSVRNSESVTSKVDASEKRCYVPLNPDVTVKEKRKHR